MNFCAKCVFIPLQLSHSEKKHLNKSENLNLSFNLQTRDCRKNVRMWLQFESLNAQSRYEPVVCCVLRLSKSANSHVDDNQNLILSLFSFSLFITNCSLFL